jgi:hypothetical protein
MSNSYESLSNKTGKIHKKVHPISKGYRAAIRRTP